MLSAFAHTRQLNISMYSSGLQSASLKYRLSSFQSIIQKVTWLKCSNTPTVSDNEKLILLLLYTNMSRMSYLFTIHPTDLQNVNITLRILFRPVTTQLPRIFTSIGEDYDERVLPSITTEVLKAVVVSISHEEESLMIRSYVLVN